MAVAEFMPAESQVFVVSLQRSGGLGEIQVCWCTRCIINSGLLGIGL